MKTPASKTPAVQAKKNTAPFQKGGAHGFFRPNRPSSSFFSGVRSGGLPVQAKLSVGRPGDVYEKEADHMAGQVLQKLNTPQAPIAPQAPTTPLPSITPIGPATPVRPAAPIQEKCAECE